LELVIDEFEFNSLHLKAIDYVTSQYSYNREDI